MQVSRPTIYAALKRWTEEGVAGLDEKSRARKGPRKVTFKITNEVRKLQENPLLGKWRMSAALSRIGIEVSPTTCGRFMEANRQLYGLEKPQRPPREKLEMPFKAVRRHQFWSCDIRYIEEHLLPDPKPVYSITVFENFSRSILASAISTTQTQWDYLAVLTDAIRRYGAPEALVTDGGGQFYSNVALQLYDMLGIRKERIDPGQPWQDYAETHFRSPQLDLWQLSDTEWLLALRRPEPSARKKASKIVALAQQLPLPLFGATG